jgi:hypothetical protein
VNASTVVQANAPLNDDWSKHGKGSGSCQTLKKIFNYELIFFGFDLD